MDEIQTLTDEQLVTKFRDGDKRAGDELVCRYEGRVLALARKYYLSDGDADDLVQEGMCGLSSAMLNFGSDGENSGTFGAYAYACIKNRILDAVKIKGINCVADDGETADDASSPEDEVIGDESAAEFTDRMKLVLSPLEYRTMQMYIDGASMIEMVEATGKTYKQLDNALVRAKRKIRTLLWKGE